jgi:hypothetical protein
MVPPLALSKDSTALEKEPTPRGLFRPIPRFQLLVTGNASGGVCCIFHGDPPFLDRLVAGVRMYLSNQGRIERTESSVNLQIREAQELEDIHDPMFKEALGDYVHEKEKEGSFV